MKITLEQEYHWLTVLELLYLLRVKYPNDEYLNKAVASIAFSLGDNLEAPIEGLIELAEMSYVDRIDLDFKKPTDHYYEVVRKSLKRLAEIEKNNTIY